MAKKAKLRESAYLENQKIEDVFAHLSRECQTGEANGRDLEWVSYRIHEMSLVGKSGALAWLNNHSEPPGSDGSPDQWATRPTSL